MRRRVVRAPVDVRVGRADHVQRLVLHLVHQPRGRRRTAVGDSVAVVPRLMSPRVVDHRVILGREVMDLGLFCVIVVVTRTLDHVGRIVGRARGPALRERVAADHLLHAGRRGLHQGFFQLLGVAGSVAGRVGVGGVGWVGRRMGRRSGRRRSHRLEQGLLTNNS